MPKLPSKVSKTVDSSEQVSTSFELLKPGKYVTNLFEVDVEEHPNYPDHVSVWVASFNNLYDVHGKKYPGRQWLRLNVVMNDKMPANYPKTEDKWATFVRMANGQMKGFFENMGFTADSDTDEMIGSHALLDIGIRTIQRGARTGEKVNDVKGVAQIPDELADAIADGKFDGEADEDADTF